MGFCGFLRQSTAVNVIIGPFVDSVDGDTEETGLTIAQADVRLSKNAGADAQKNDNTTCAHEGDGFYMCELDATDTNTVGLLTLWVHVAGALAVRHNFQIIEEAIYDAIWAASATGLLPANVTQFGGSAGTFAAGRPEVNVSHIAGSAVSTTTAQLGVNVVQISGDGAAADNVETAFDDTAGAVRWSHIIDQGTAQAATSSTLQLRSAAAFANDELNGCWAFITGGSAGVGQVRQIIDYVSSTDTATIDPVWTTTPSGTITYQILPAAMVAADVMKFVGVSSTSSGGRPEVNTTHAAGTAWNSGGITASTLASDTITAAAIASDAITAAKIATGAIDADAIASDAITAAKIASDALTAAKFAANAITAAKLDPDVTTELQAGLATAANLATVDTVVDEIRARLSALATKTANVVDDAGNSASTFKTDLSESANDHYKDCLLKFTSGSLAEQVKKITAYNGTSKFVTVSGGFTAEPADGDDFEIIND